jgi:hypothetical protein
MRPQRYGSRRRAVEERVDPLDTFGGLLADIAAEMSPVVNMYRAGLFEDEYPTTPFATPRDRMLSLLEEPEYQRYVDNIVSSGMGATTKVAKAMNPAKTDVLRKLKSSGKKAKFYADNKARVQKRLEQAQKDLGDNVYLDPEKEVTGSFRVKDDIPLTFRGKEPYQWTAEDLAAFEAKFGQAGDLQYSPKITQRLQDDGTRTMLQRLQDSDEVQYPAGFDGKYSLGDQYRILAEGLDPNRMPADDYWAMQTKKVASVDPENYRGGLTDNQVYNALMFGLTSPNNPLDPNLMAVNRLRATSPEDVSFMADQIPWNYSNKSERLKELTKDWKPKKFKDVAASKKSGKTKMNTYWVDGDGNPVRAFGKLQEYRKTKEGDNRETVIKAQYSSKIQDAFGLQAEGRGGIGAGGSAVYTNLAEFAQMFRDNPQFFRQRADEDWVDYTQRLSAQMEGLGYKTASMADVWTSPAAAQIAPVDRHMARMMTDKTPSWQEEMVKQWNAKNPKKVSTYEELQQTRGGRGFISENAMNYAYMPKQSMTYRMASGELNPRLPEKVRDTQFFTDPEKVEIIPERYAEVIRNIGQVRPGQEIFPSQWGTWDLIRKRNAPHQVMNPAIENYPRMSSDQMQRVRQKYSDNSFLTYADDTPAKDTLPSGKAQNPMDLFMLSKVGPMLGPAALGGSLLFEED